MFPQPRYPLQSNRFKLDAALRERYSEIRLINIDHIEDKYGLLDESARLEKKGGRTSILPRVQGRTVFWWQRPDRKQKCQRMGLPSDRMRHFHARAREDSPGIHGRFLRSANFWL
jgi:hypothetical protein